MLILWGLLFLAIAIITGYMAFGGIAIAISFFSKILFFIALLCFIIFMVLIIFNKMKAKSEHKVKD